MIFLLATKVPRITNSKSKSSRLKRMKCWRMIGILSSFILLGISGTIRPSIINSIYFLMLLVSLIKFGLGGNLGKNLTSTFSFASFILALHIIIIVAYNSPLLKTFFPDDDLLRRICGLEGIIEFNEDGFQSFKTLDIDQFLHLPILALTYNVLISTTTILKVSFFITNLKTNQISQ